MFEVGTTFRIKWITQGDREEVFTVIDGDPDPSKGIISDKSPLGKALLSGKNIYEAEGKFFKFNYIDPKLPQAVSDKRERKRLRNIIGDEVDSLRISFESYSANGKNKSIIESPLLDIHDINLCLHWCRSQSDDEKYNIEPKDRIELHDENYYGLGSDYLLGKMLSARAAEKASLKFLKETGSNSFADISIRQINSSSSHDDLWKKCDLLSDGIAYDVKNARWSRKNRLTYSENIVPKFKYHRGEDVKIIGVLSPYLWPSNLINHSLINFDRPKDVHILGFFDAKKLNDLSTYFNSEILMLDFYEVDPIS